MIKINLLPPERRKKTKRAAPAAKEGAGKAKRALSMPGLDPAVLLPAVTAALVFLFVAGSFFWLSYRVNHFREQREELQVELNKLNVVIRRMDQLKEQTRSVMSRMDVIVQLDKNRFIWPRILDDISTSLPRYTWLQTISEVTPFPLLSIRIEGHTMSNILLSQLLANLEQRKSLTGVKFISSSERELGGYDMKYYVIECKSTFNQQPDSTVQTVAAK